jgi:hypothetical protein
VNTVELGAVELLEKAAKILERDGWTPHFLQSIFDEKRCVMGGLMTAAGIRISSFVGARWAKEDPVAVVAIAELGKVVDPDNSHRSDGWDRVVNWNNADNRTQQEVLDALRVASMALCNEAEVAT